MGDSVESSNREQIERLNQRGGRTLSVIDLVIGGTLSAEMAGICAAAMVRGVSLMTAAGPGGAGKTTLMAGLLGFLAQGRQIVTIESEADLPVPSPDAESDAAYLVHEIGSGPYYGYLWGGAVGRYLALTHGGGSIASCLHADTVAELYSALTRPELGARASDIGGIGLMLFITARQKGGGIVRRVSTMNVPGVRIHQEAFRWVMTSAEFVRCVGVSAFGRLAGACGCGETAFGRLARSLQNLFERLAESGINDFGDVRESFLESGLK